MALVGLLALFSCSVKEDRVNCPVYVTVLTDRFVDRGFEDGVVSFQDEGKVFGEHLNFLAGQTEEHVVSVSRDYARVSVFSGVENARISESTLYIPYGQPGDLLWAYWETFEAKDDEYVVDADPYKQYCLVKFLFDDSSHAPLGYKWRFRIKANCSGMNIFTGEPLEGQYCCPVTPNAVGEWYGVIPRQNSNTMVMEVYLPIAGNEAEGCAEYVIDLGARFESVGYDWSKKDLEDMTVKVGFSSAGFDISVEEWKDDDSYSDIHV